MLNIVLHNVHISYKYVHLYTNLYCIVKKCISQIRNFLLVEMHSILHHASLHHLPQVSFVN